MPAKAVKAVVLDGNVALKAALVEDGFVAWADVGLHAPTLIWSEVAAGASQLRWRGEISGDQALRAVQRLRDAGINAVPSAELIEDALELARRFGWAKTYDAEYVTLAKRLALPLVTSDGRLASRIAGEIEVLTPAELDELRSATASEESPRS